MEVPIGNREARSNYSKAKLEEKQTVFNTRKVEQEVVVEVRKAVRQVKTNVERGIKASKRPRVCHGQGWKQRKRNLMLEGLPVWK